MSTDTAYLHPNPMNVDKIIQEVQLALKSRLTWLSVAYGRAWRAFSKPGNKDVLQFPEAYAGDGEYKSMLPHDLLTSYCFFYVRDKGEPIDYAPNQQNEYKYPVDLIFWYDMKKIRPETDHIITENLMAEVKNVLKNFSSVVVVSTYTEPNNIFSGFTLAEVETQFIRYPYGGFKLSLTIQLLETYDENC